MLQDYDDLLHDLSGLQREDREKRQKVVAKIPVAQRFSNHREIGALLVLKAASVRSCIPLRLA